MKKLLTVFLISLPVLAFFLHRKLNTAIADNVHSFAKTFSIIKCWHPESKAKDLDWNILAVNSVDLFLNIKH